MIIDQRQIDFYKKIANSLFLPMILNDYGQNSQTILLHMTDSISKIYKNLDYNSFENVVIFESLNHSCYLSTITGLQPNIIRSYENLTQSIGKKIIIEVKPNGELHYLIDYSFNINSIRNSAIIYQFDKLSQTETIYGKIDEKVLPSIPDTDSYFAIQTYKELEIAMEDYNTKVARFSECEHLKYVWADKNRLFFKPKPEHILRDSLTYFLKIRLRNSEVRPEQIVDKSHPVDIKITWTLTNHLALIEIKWLGKALQTKGKKRIKKIYTRKRALDGAKQLADYLDANILQAPNKIAKGYLVIFDARRWHCNKDTKKVNKSNGMKYLNEIINFVPDYSITRTDFAKPIKLFMQPDNMTN